MKNKREFGLIPTGSGIFGETPNIATRTVAFPWKKRFATAVFVLGLGSQSLVSAADASEEFQKLAAAKAQEALSRSETTVAGTDHWLFLAAELRHIGAGKFWGEAALKATRASNPDRADPLPAIVDFHRQLRQLDIELWIVPVPPKAVIYARKLGVEVPPVSAPTRLDSHHQVFYRALAAEGVTVIDFTEAFLAAQNTNGEPFYCRTDSHWSTPALRLVAEKLASQIKTRDWYAALPKSTFMTETKEAWIVGDLIRTRSGQTNANETVSLSSVKKSVTGPAAAVETSETSPVLLLGDSHNLIFHAGDDMHARGAGLPDQLAYELGFAVDLIAVRGSGATPARVSLLRKVRRDANYLRAKKVVVWCFAAREFTESDGWLKVPIVEPAK